MYILNDKIVTTRKDRRCDACFRLVEKGSKMRARVNTHNGYISVWRVCLTCDELTLKFRDFFADFVLVWDRRSRY